MAHIKIEEGPRKGVTLVLEGDVLVGRAPSSGLCLPDARASREHALIRAAGEACTITDLGSANGTFINGEALPKGKSHHLQDGDEITLCSTRMRFIASDHSMSLNDFSPESGYAPPPGHETDAVTQIVPKKRDGCGSECVLSVDEDVITLSAEDEDRPERLRELIRRLKYMLRVSSIIAEVEEGESMFARILDCVLEMVPAAERVYLMKVDGDEQEMAPVIARYAGEEAKRDILAISHTIINSVIQKKQAVLSADAPKDFGMSQSIVDLSIRAMMCAPLFYKGELLGILYADTQSVEKNFSEDDLVLLVGIASQVALALKNMELFEKVRAITQLASGLGDGKG